MTSLPFDALIETTCLSGGGDNLNPPTALSEILLGFVGFPPPKKRHRHDLTYSSSTAKRWIRWKQLPRTLLLFIRPLSLSLLLSLSLGTAQRERRFKGASLRFLGLGDFLALSLDSQLNVDVSTCLSGWWKGQCWHFGLMTGAKSLPSASFVIAHVWGREWLRRQPMTDTVKHFNASQ